MANKQDENDGKHIYRVMSTQICKNHGATLDQACWNVLTVNGIMSAICGARARRAGCNGEITPTFTPNQKKEYQR